MTRVLLIVLAYLAGANSLAHQQKMGLVYSPVEYGRIHFKHSMQELEHYGQHVLGLQEDIIQHMDEVSPKGEKGKAWRSLARNSRDRTRALLERLNAHWKHTLGVFSAPPTKENDAPLLAAFKILQRPRPKRQVMALAAAAGALFAFGMGIKNTQDLHGLYQATQELQTNQEQLIASLGLLSDRMIAGFQKLERSDKLTDYANHIKRLETSAVSHALELTARWTSGLYRLTRGELDPSVISVEDLSRGLTDLTEKGRAVGMVLAPLENRFETLFSLPVSVLVRHDEIHVWISVPMVLASSPVFEALYFEHVPVPFNQYLLQFDTRELFLLTDSARTLHAEITAEELAACDRHRTSYFCTRDTFFKQQESCTLALLRGDKKQALRACKKSIYHAPELLVTQEVSNKSRSVVRLYAGHSLTVMRICPRQEQPSPIRMAQHETVHLEVPLGCYLRAGDTVVFLPHKPEEVSIACEGEEWIADEILEDLARDDVQSVLQTLNFTEGRLPLPVVREHLRGRTPGWLYPISACVLLFIAAVALDLGLRYFLLARERCCGRTKPQPILKAVSYREQDLYEEARAHYQAVKARVKPHETVSAAPNYEEVQLPPLPKKRFGVEPAKVEAHIEI